MGGPESLGLIAVELRGIDGENPLRPGDPRPWIAAAPIPPTPITATLSPGRTSAA